MRPPGYRDLPLPRRPGGFCRAHHAGGRHGTGQYHRGAGSSRAAGRSQVPTDRAGAWHRGGALSGSFAPGQHPLKGRDPGVGRSSFQRHQSFCSYQLCRAQKRGFPDRARQDYFLPQQNLLLRLLSGYRCRRLSGTGCRRGTAQPNRGVRVRHRASGAAMPAFFRRRRPGGFRSFTALDTLKTRLAERQSAAFEFNGTATGWCRASFIVVDRDEQGQVSHVVFAIQSIREEKEQELQNRLLLKKKRTKPTEPTGPKRIFCPG